VFHHGDHTSQEFFPTDKHKEIARQQGYSQLTKLGIQQLYELGQYMRKRSSHFLSVIYVQSTDCDHTLMSAQASLAGLYPPTQGQIWNLRILWQPIPVHSATLLYLPFSHCPKYKKLLRETFATGDFQRQFKHYKQLLKFLATHTGYPLKKLTTERIWKLSDTLQYEVNKIIESFSVRTKLRKLLELLLQAEFESSPFSFRCYFKNYILGARKPSYHQKMVMFSMHAATIAALQMALNVCNGKLPPHSEKSGQVSA
ncbi:hypothetical protein HGM15179_002035, partial [Zosterops borbonicus]